MYFKNLVKCVILLWLAQYMRASESVPSANNSAESVMMSVLGNLTNLPRADRLMATKSADEDEGLVLDDERSLDEEEDDINATALGMFVGGQCKGSCSDALVNVYCDPNKGLCVCAVNHPVHLGPQIGCEMPTLIGDMCFYTETCSYYDSNAMCKQIGHNAMCDCKPGYHTVGIQKGVKRMFCSEDIVLLHTDLPSLLVVASGIAILSGLLCFVLKLFSNNRFADGGHYANANLAPPLLFSDNQWINGIPLTVHGRPASRSSSQRSTTHLAHYRSKGVLVPASRAGAARAAAILLIPCHLQASRAPDVLPSSNEELESPQGNTWMYPHPFPDVQTTLYTNELLDRLSSASSRIGLDQISLMMVSLVTMGVVCVVLFFSRLYRSRWGGKMAEGMSRSRRGSISSVHSNASSHLSYSQRRFEQENQQREQRATMKAAREEAARSAVPPTPSPMSTDHLLPSCEELNEDDPLGIASGLSIPSADSSGANSLDNYPLAAPSKI